MPTTNDLTIDLLTCVLGKRTALKVFEGRLDPLFAPRGKTKAYHRRLAAARELTQRWMYETLQRGPVCTDPRVVTDYLVHYFAGQEHESFVALFLDNRHRVLAAVELFRGTLDGASVHPREVVKEALARNAAALIVAHNHPSGVSEPSEADRLITRRLREALGLVDIRVLDHVVVGGAHAISFAERGIL